MTNEFIQWFSEINKNSGNIVGGKGANLGEMFNSKFPVPPGFVVTTKAYYYFIERARIKEKIFTLLDSIDVDDTNGLEEKAKEIRSIIVNADFPSELESETIDAYDDLSVDKKSLENAGKYAQRILKNSSEPIFVAVRSSATTEDLEGSSFAGQQESFLNIKGNRALIVAIKKVFASLFTARAIYYRMKRGFSKEKFALAVVVQKMIDSEKSGVIFSNNPVKKDDTVLIEAVYGLGEGIVLGKINPDSYEVSRDLKILEKSIGDKKIAFVRDSQGDTNYVKLTPTRSKTQVLEETEVKKLADYAIKLEEHYGKPQDIEFSVENNEIYIVQTRPITTSFKAQEVSEEIKGKIILTGLGASPGIASGKARIIHDLSELGKVEKGDILVTEMTNPDMVITMQKSSAIVTDEGGVTSHASIVSREMGIPAVVGTEIATKAIKDGQLITVDGFNGRVYEGLVSNTRKVEIKPIINNTKTKIKAIVDLPDFAERAALSKCEAVGLLRLEGIIAESGKHPLKFQKENKLDEYTKILQTGIEKISQPFKEIWVRTSDIRSDEFSHIEGAPKQIELNPMLGMHGIRFSLKNPQILEAEFNAIKQCAINFPDKTFGVMMPQIISVEEVREAKKIAEKVGLINNTNEKINVKIGIMVETPAACLVIKDLVKEGLDFISLGTNDLTQFTLAIDRGNEDVQYLYNELNPAVLNAIKRVLRTCEEENVESSICGQAGSNKEMVKFLIQNNISSISVNADAAYDVSVLVSELEELKKNKPENKNKIPLMPNKMVFRNNNNSQNDKINNQDNQETEEQNEYKNNQNEKTEERVLANEIENTFNELNEKNKDEKNLQIPTYVAPIISAVLPIIQNIQNIQDIEEIKKAQEKNEQEVHMIKELFGEDDVNPETETEIDKETEKQVEKQKVEEIVQKEIQPLVQQEQAEQKQELQSQEQNQEDEKEQITATPDKEEKIEESIDEKTEENVGENEQNSNISYPESEIKELSEEDLNEILDIF